jgi:hypothetical protein
VLLFIQCDNAGENKTTQEELRRLAPQVQFEFTAPDTPQQNGPVERKFATLYGRVQATMNRARLPNKVRHKLWAEAANMANEAENMSLKVGKTMPPFKELFGLEPKIFGIYVVLGKSALQRKDLIFNQRWQIRALLSCIWVMQRIMDKRYIAFSIWIQSVLFCLETCVG